MWHTVCMRAQAGASTSLRPHVMQSLFLICFLCKNHKRIHQDSPSHLSIYVTHMCERDPLLVPSAQPDPSRVNSRHNIHVLSFLSTTFLAENIHIYTAFNGLIKYSTHCQKKEEKGGNTPMNALTKCRMCTNTNNQVYTLAAVCEGVTSWCRTASPQSINGLDLQTS